MKPSRAAPRLLDGKPLRGFNVHHSSSVFVQRVHLGALAGHRSGEAGPEFAAAFVERFAGRPAGGEFLERLKSGAGVRFEQALLEAILAVEHAAARSMGRLDALEFATIVRDPASRHEVELVWSCPSGSVSRTAARVGFAGFQELIPAHLVPGRRASSGKFAVLLRKLEQRGRRRQWSSSTAAMALAAMQRGVPYEPLVGEYLRLGHGALQHVVSASTPESTTHAAVSAALELIFPVGAPASVPTALILGDRGTGAVARDLDGLLRAAGSTVGLATRKLTTIAGRPVDPTSLGRGSGARFLLGDPRVEILVFTASPRRIVERGLRLDRATVTAILDPKEEGDPDTERGALDVAASATSNGVVVHADHPQAKRLIRELGRPRVTLLSRRPRRAILRHVAAGGSAVVLVRSEGNESLDLLHPDGTAVSVSVSLLRSTSSGARDLRLRQAMFTLALAFGLGLSGGEVVRAFEKRRFLRR